MFISAFAKHIDYLTFKSCLRHISKNQTAYFLINRNSCNYVTYKFRVMFWTQVL
jgi:hypothetical protein